MAHPALTDVSVLHKCFQYLAPNQVKQIRTVCKDWKDPATSILGKSTMLNLRSVFNDDGFRRILWSENFTRIKVKSIQERYQNNFECDKASCLFLETNKDWIQELFLCVDSNFGLQMKNLFETLVFENLRKISILEMGTEETPPKALRPIKLSLLLKIRELQLDAAGSERTNAPQQTGHRYLDLFQELINKSPNLERLTITGNVYPDLASAANLKAFIITAFPVQFSSAEDEAVDDDENNYRKMAIRGDFLIDSLLEMLVQVNNRLEELTLKATFFHNDAHDFNTLFLIPISVLENRDDPATFWRLPTLPKLRFLTIHPIDGFTKQLYFSENCFPSLEALNITDNDNEIMDNVKLLLRNMGPRTTVKELSFTLRHEIEFRDVRGIYYCGEKRIPFLSLQQMATKFPNVKKLDFAWNTVSLELPDSPISSDWLMELGKFTLLEELTLRLNCKISLSQLMGNIDGLGGNGLKNLKVKAKLRDSDVTGSHVIVRENGWIHFDLLFGIITRITYK